MDSSQQDLFLAVPGFQITLKIEKFFFRNLMSISVTNKALLF